MGIPTSPRRDHPRPPAPHRPTPRLGIPTQDAEPVLLVAHELVINAVEHAGTPLHLAASFDGAEVVRS